VAIQQHYQPHPPLSAFVETFWSYEGNTPAHVKERRLPDGSMSLVINLRDDQMRIFDRRDPGRYKRYRGGVISGPHSAFSLLDTASLTSALGAQFKPGGAASFLHRPAAELRDTVVSADAIWGAAALELREQLLEARTPERRFSLLERFLLERLAPSWAAHPAVACALAAFQNVSRRPTIAAVTERIGISQTRFTQVVRDAVGLTPKQLRRILRFQEVLGVLESGKAVRWIDLAAACGYCDQAHLIHEFRAFSGLTPTAYLALRGAQRNHIALPD
jgi:AraC-like DNA-binding protein